MTQAESTSQVERRLFWGLCFIACLAGASFLYFAHIRAARHTAASPYQVVLSVGATIAAIDVTAPAAIRGSSRIAFRNLRPGSSYGALAYADLADASRSRQATTLHCSRVYERAGTTVCLALTDDPGRRFVAYILDAGRPADEEGSDGRLAVRQVIALAGLPSRARVSADGRFVAFTVFTVADSYMRTGFSTRTMVVDVASGETVGGDLEQWAVSKDGQPLQAVDFNYWGVTFPAVTAALQAVSTSGPASTGPAFFATLGTGGHQYLVKADAGQRRFTVMRDGIECPSLSPDGTRIAFKKRTGTDRLGHVTWRPAMLDLATGEERVLSDARDFDDQIEWLDDRRVLYAIRRTATPPSADIWMANADGSGEATRFMSDADSPAVVRNE